MIPNNGKRLKKEINDSYLSCNLFLLNNHTILAILNYIEIFQTIKIAPASLVQDYPRNLKILCLFFFFFKVLMLLYFLFCNLTKNKLNNHYEQYFQTVYLVV